MKSGLPAVASSSRDGLLRINFLKGGLDGWRAKGFPVEPYASPSISTRAGGATPQSKANS